MTDCYVLRERSIPLRGNQGTITVDLVSRARRGDQNAFTLLYQEYVHSIYKYIFIRVNNHTEQAEDLTQVVFLKALNNLDTYQFTGKPFSSWLFRIAHNIVIDYYRKCSNDNGNEMTLHESALLVSEEDPAVLLEQSAVLQELNEAIGRLPAQQKEVISLRFTSGLSVAETAGIMGKTEGTVKKLQHVALSRLKSVLKR